MKPHLTVCAAILVYLAAASAQAGLIGHWTFDTDFSDSSGNGLHGTGVGDAAAGQADPGRPTGVMTLSDGYISVADNNLLDLPNTFTLAAWVKPAATGGGDHILRKGPDDDAGSNTVYLLRQLLNGGEHKQQLQVRDSSHTILANILEPYPSSAGPGAGANGEDAWTFVVATYDGPSGVSNLFVNDVTNPIGTGGASGAPAASTGTLRIGLGFPGGNLNGAIDDVWIFDHVLSGAELRQLSGVPEPASAVCFVLASLLAVGAPRSRC